MYQPTPDPSQEEHAFTRVLSVPLPGEVRGEFGVPKIIARHRVREHRTNSCPAA